MSRKIPILLYHRVGERDGSFMDEYTVSPGCFEQQMEWIRRNGWRPAPLEDFLDGRIYQARVPSLVITFDDGFASNRVHAWPVLEKYRFPSATFLVMDRIGGRNTWDGAGQDNYPLLTEADISAADRELMAFYSHSLTHADLPEVDADTLRREVAGSRSAMPRVGGLESFFAYPFGDLNEAVVAAVRKAGYLAALSCIEGLNSDRRDPYLLRRVEVKEGDAGFGLLLKLTTGRNLKTWLRSKASAVKRRIA